MIGELVRSIPDLGILPILIMVLSVVVFVGTIVWAIIAKKEYISKMSGLPFDSSLNNSNNEDK